MSYFHTFEGHRIEGVVQPDQISDRTIAKVLSRTGRFGNHSTHKLSVAQHSILVAKAFIGTQLYLPALLHDAHEAYTGFGDVLRASKELLRRETTLLDELEGAVDIAIATHYGFDVGLFYSPEIKERDTRALLAEHRDLLVTHEPPCETDLLPLEDAIIALPENEAYYAFLGALQTGKSFAVEETSQD